MMRFHVTAIVLGLALACPGAARADDQLRQPPVRRTLQPGRPGSFEISIGGELLAPQTLGSSTATLTRSTGTTSNFFSVAGKRATTPALRGRIGYNITSMFTVEGGLVVGRGNVQGDVSGDAENVSALTVTEQMTQYFLDASLLMHLTGATFSKGAGVPFLEGGAGYLRQLHQGNIASNTGQIYHFGGGITYMFSKRPGRLTGLGFRADAHVYVPRKGYSYNTSQHPFVGAGAALLLAF